MRERIGVSRFLAWGIAIGIPLFLLNYWWIGTISLSLIIALLVGGSIIVAKLFQHGLAKKEG
jgi:hypothetical protein